MFKVIQRIVIYAALMLAFFAVQGAIFLPFISELRFEKARALERGFQREKAQTVYASVAALNPFDAQYMVGLADFLLRQSAYRKDKIGLLKKAENLYKEALKINPDSAQYMLILGRVQIELFMKDQMNNRKHLSEGLGNIKGAILYDPNGANIAYLAGHSGVAVWDFIERSDKGLFLDRLKYALQYRPRYSDDIYSHLWKTLGDFKLLQETTPTTLKSHLLLYRFIRKNNLWQFRKEEMALINSLKKRQAQKMFSREEMEKERRIEEIRISGLMRGEFLTNRITPEFWEGVAGNGRDIYENGRMFWEGTIDAPFNVPAGRCLVAIQAKGSVANRVFPYMVVELDGEEIGEGFVKADQWREYTFKVDTDGGVKVLSVSYMNDISDEARYKDRNLYIGEASVILSPKGEESF